MNRRRKLIAALGAGALAAPFSLFAQQPGKVWRVGHLTEGRRPVSLESISYLNGFIARMRELGYVEGKNLAIEWRFAEGRLELMPALAAELVRLPVDAILTVSTPATRAAQQATSEIPIVMTTVDNPVGGGFVKSMARPGGNITGFTILSSELGPKHLEMLVSMVPGLSRVAVLVNPANPVQATFLKNIQAAGQKINVKILPVEARTTQEIDKAFAVMVRERAGAVIVSFNSLFSGHRREIAELAARNRLPSICGRKEDVESGYLMSYGPDTTDIYRRAATYMDKLFKGVKPADIPVEQPTKFELFINGKTAKALGLKIPYSLQIMVDKVIE
jgi:putative ABC transport system substrate-binding protein